MPLRVFEVFHAHAPVVLQLHARVLRRGVGIVEHDVAGEAAPDGELLPGTIAPVLEAHLAVHVEHLDEHHGLHRIASRKRRMNACPLSKPVPRSVTWLTSACSSWLTLTSASSKS